MVHGDISFAHYVWRFAYNKSWDLWLILSVQSQQFYYVLLSVFWSWLPFFLIFTTALGSVRYDYIWLCSLLLSFVIYCTFFWGQSCARAQKDRDQCHSVLWARSMAWPRSETRGSLPIQGAKTFCVFCSPLQAFSFIFILEKWINTWNSKYGVECTNL